MAEVDTLPKPWHYLENARKQRESIREDIEKLKATPPSEDGAKQDADRLAYQQRLDVMESRIKNPEKEAWSDDRPAMKNDLIARVQAVKNGEAGLETVEKRLSQEKDAWYREVLLANPDLLDFGHNDVRKEDLLAALADPECHIDDIITPVWESLNKPEKWSEQLETFLERIASAGDDPQSLKAIYAQELFKDRTTGATLDHAQPYLDAYEGEADQSLDQVLGTLIRDLSAGRSSGSQRTTLRKRLDELTRAKTAIEQEKASQAKSRSAAGAREAAAIALLEPLPPCYTCQDAVDKTQVLSCSHCQLALQLAGEAGEAKKKLTVFCSEECLKKGQLKHEDEDHECAARDDCTSRTVISEDVDMEDDSASLLPVACAQCLEEKEVTIYCSSSCADANIREHRQGKHGIKTDPDDSSGTYKSMEEVAKLLDESTSGLKIQWLE